jgi:hypothetical protein
MEKARRCVERVFFAGDEHLLSRSLLVRRGGTWEPFDRPAGARTAPRGHGPARHRGPDQPPRQYQEHPSWPGGERLHPVSGGDRMTGVPVGPVPVGLGPLGGGPLGPGRAPHHTGPLAPVGHAGPYGPRPRQAPMTSTGSMAPLTTTGTGSMSPVPRPAPTRDGYAGSGYPPHPADVAPYSAVPYSAMPYSAMPYSAIPNSAIPYSAMPNSISPYGSETPSAYLHSRGARPAQSWSSADPYPSGAYLEQSYSEPPSESHGQDASSGPEYPGSWGSTPIRSTRPELRTGPRARFAR